MYALLIIVSSLSILLDQFIKILIVNNISLYERINGINNFFSLTFVKNTGGAFSLFEGNIIIFLIVTIVALIFFYINFIKNKQLNKFNQIVYGVIFGGIIGNFTDRLIRGFVVDYIELSFIDFPIFNLADILIVTGIVLLLIIIIKEEKHGKINNN